MATDIRTPSSRRATRAPSRPSTRHVRVAAGLARHRLRRPLRADGEAGAAADRRHHRKPSEAHRRRPRRGRLRSRRSRTRRSRPTRRRWPMPAPARRRSPTRPATSRPPRRKPRRKTLEDELNAKLAEAEKTIAATKQAAMANVRGIADDATKAIVERLIGTAPSRQRGRRGRRRRAEALRKQPCTPLSNCWAKPSSGSRSPS